MDSDVLQIDTNRDNPRRSVRLSFLGSPVM